MGAEVVRRVLWLAAALLLSSAPLAAQDRYAVVITGAPGGDEFAAKYRTWEQRVTTALVDRLGFAKDHVDVLSGAADASQQSSSRAHVERSLDHLKQIVHPDDVVLILLMGHGSADGGVAKFNLPGPDLTSVEWAGLLRDLHGRLVVVNSSGASFPFLADLAARGRIVITATDSIAQRYDTVFPDAWLEALTEPAADLDKNGRVSVWELFVYASRQVARHYTQENLLSTERALMDDTGGGIGLDATSDSGADGALARATYLEREPVEVNADAAMTALLVRRRALEERAEVLRQQKKTMAPEAWDREFEQLMIELARVSHRIRAGS